MSMFMAGELCRLAPLEGTEFEARQWVNGVMGNLELRHLFTGSLPMRWIDCQKEWEAERQKGSVQFGIWTDPMEETDWGLIGTCGLYSAREVYKSYEFRILMWSEHGRGVGSEATRLVTDYAFRRMNANRVWLGVSEANERAWKCYERVGYKLEGVLREEIYCFGEYVNARRYGLLRREWEELLTVWGFPRYGPVPVRPNEEGKDKGDEDMPAL